MECPMGSEQGYHASNNNEEGSLTIVVCLLFTSLLVFCIYAFYTNTIFHKIRYPKRPLFNFTTSDFETIKNKSDHFVDKTKFIEVLLNDSPMVLITAPKRFGKSTNMSMIKAFVENEQQKLQKNGKWLAALYTFIEFFVKFTFHSLKTNTRLLDKLFHDDNLYIYQCYCEGEKGTKCGLKCPRNVFNKHYQKYPVIHISFRDIKPMSDNPTYETILNKFLETLSKTFQMHSYLLTHHMLWKKFNVSDFERYLDPKKLMRAETEMFVIKALPFLTQVLYTCFNHEVFILIDDYDAPINHSIFKKDININKVIELLNSVFSELLKEKGPVGRALLTGTSYYASVGLTRLNYVVKHMFLKGNGNNDTYSEFYGLTSKEVENLVTKFVHKFWNGDQKVATEDVKSYYNGYRSLGKNAYRIHSFSLVLHTLKYKELRNYRDQSALIEGTVDAVKLPIVTYAISKLIMEWSLSCRIPSTIEKSDIQNLRNMILEESKSFTRPDMFLAFLFHQGYFNIMQNETNDNFNIQVPNYLIKKELQYLLKQHYGYRFDEQVREAVIGFDAIAHSVNDKKVRFAVKALMCTLKVLNPVTDTRNKYSFHNIIFYILCKTQAIICTEFDANRPDRRLDLVFRFQNVAIIIDIKYENPGGSRATLQQIKINNYLSTLRTKFSSPSMKGLLMGLSVNKNNRITISYQMED